VKWILTAATCCAIYVSLADYKCNLGEFKYISLQTHNPTQRMQITLQWIKNNGKFCSIEKLYLIADNTSAMLGTADNIEFRMILNDFIQEKK
jgi:hypothetical protein|tara:strand:+ start:276 stop:551 length:276 start_codon:yes stop_codon:yes gene_type:complete